MNLIYKFIIIIGITAAVATLAGEPSLKEQILSVDKELGVLRKTTLSDPQVKAAEVEFRAALIKLKAAQDDALIRTNPQGKELVEKYRKLLAQYKAELKSTAAKESAKK
jgi:thymidylate synthase ThyX